MGQLRQQLSGLCGTLPYFYLWLCLAGRALNVVCRPAPACVQPNFDLSESCPKLVNSSVCCSVEQYVTLKSQIQQAAPLFGQCPACLNNFKEFWCEFTCSPNQAQFVTVTDFRCALCWAWLGLA